RLVGDPPAVLESRRGAVLHRVLRLGPGAREVARAVSVLGRISLESLVVVEGLTGLDGTAVSHGFDMLLRANVLVRSGRDSFHFAPPILREPLRADLGPAELRRAHATAAAILGSLPGRETLDGLLELAAHIAESASTGDADAARILAEAGDISAAVAPRSAAQWYERALSVLSPGAAVRPLVLARRTRALYLSWNLDSAVATGLEALRLLEPGSQRDRVAGIVVGSLTSLGRLEEALELSDTRATAEAATGSGGGSRLHTQRATILFYLERLEE